MKTNLENLRNIKVIAASPGTGKSTLAKNYPNVFYDLESIPFRHIIKSEFKHLTEEQLKGLKRDRNPDWPNNYVAEIENKLKENKIVLITQHRDMLNLLRQKGIPFLFVVPKKQNKKEYELRWRERGNNETYIVKRLNEFIEDIDYALKSSEPCIQLKKGEYLENYAYIFMNK